MLQCTSGVLEWGDITANHTLAIRHWNGETSNQVKTDKSHQNVLCGINKAKKDADLSHGTWSKIWSLVRMSRFAQRIELWRFSSRLCLYVKRVQLRIIKLLSLYVHWLPPGGASKHRSKCSQRYSMFSQVACMWKSASSIMHCIHNQMLCTVAGLLSFAASFVW